MLPWAKAIDYEDLLRRDARLLYEHCGEDVLLAVLDKFRGDTLYLDAAVLRAMQRRFIREKAGDLSVKELAITLGVSREYVYGVLRSDQEHKEAALGLFDDGDSS